MSDRAGPVAATRAFSTPLLTLRWDASPGTVRSVSAPRIYQPGRPLCRRRPALDKPSLRRRTEHAHALRSRPYAHLDDDDDYDGGLSRNRGRLLFPWPRPFSSAPANL